MSFCSKNNVLAIGVASLFVIPSVQAGDLGVALKAGSLGAGLELDYVIGENFSVRLQANKYDHDFSLEEDEVEYDATLGFSSFGAILDWHPFGGGFRISLGALSNGNDMSGVAGGPGEYEIGDNTYTVRDSDTFQLSADIDLGSGIAPYAGFGWGHSPANDGGLLLSLDIGVLMQGSPSVDLAAEGTYYDSGTMMAVDVSSDPTFQAQVTEEEQNLEDDLADFDLYPVVTLGIGYRF